MYLSINDRLARLKAKLTRERRAPKRDVLRVAPIKLADNETNSDVRWRYYHKKGYWQIWSDLPASGIIRLPMSARAIQIVSAEDVEDAEREFPKFTPLSD